MAWLSRAIGAVGILFHGFAYADLDRASAELVRVYRPGQSLTRDGASARLAMLREVTAARLPQAAQFLQTAVTQDPSDDVREFAAEALSAYPTEKTVTILIENLGNPLYLKVAKISARSLGKMGSDAQLAPAERERIATALLDAAAREPSWVREEATHAVAEMHTFGHTLEAMVNRLSRTDTPNTLKAAIVRELSLRNVRSATFVAELRAQMGTPSIDLKIQILRARVATDTVDEAVVNELVAIVTDRDQNGLYRNLAGAALSECDLKWEGVRETLEKIAGGKLGQFLVDGPVLGQIAVRLVKEDVPNRGAVLVVLKYLADPNIAMLEEEFLELANHLIRIGRANTQITGTLANWAMAHRQEYPDLSWLHHVIDRIRDKKRTGCHAQIVDHATPIPVYGKDILPFDATKRAANRPN